MDIISDEAQSVDDEEIIEKEQGFNEEEVKEIEWKYLESW